MKDFLKHACENGKVRDEKNKQNYGMLLKTEMRKWQEC